MSARTAPWLMAALAAVVAVAFALTVRLPLPFDGFAVLAAGAMAALGTLALCAWLPPQAMWTDAERLRLAFQARHGLGAASADQALATITTAHSRATTLRRAAGAMRGDMAAVITGLADRLDAAAREIFYIPDRQRGLRTVLTRSELIVDAATAHAALRARKSGAVEDASRAKLKAAAEALDNAFDRSDLAAARGLLQEVEVASDVAERLLTPRRPTASPKGKT
ncbi:MAG: hypothetical protein AAF218_07165 [Pseudomonadota bacterium]